MLLLAFSSVRHVLLSELHSSMYALASLFPSLSQKLSAPIGSGLAGPSSTVPDLFSAALSSSSRGRLRDPPAALLDSLLYSSSKLDFVRRWNVLSYQQQRAAHWLNLHHLPQAWLYIQAASHDARQMADLIRAELDTLQVRLQCASESDAEGAGAQDDLSVAGLPLAAASASSAGSSAVSAAQLLSASHWFFFVTVEVCLLCSIILFVWLLTNKPKLIPQPIAKLLGVGRFKAD